MKHKTVTFFSLRSATIRLVHGYALAVQLAAMLEKVMAIDGARLPVSGYKTNLMYETNNAERGLQKIISARR
jgi:hypothetical protein